MAQRIGITDAQIYKDLGDLVREKSTEHADKRFAPMELPQVAREAMDEQYSNGYDTGYSEGSDSAWENGYQTGKNEGIEEGKAEGIEQGKQAMMSAVQQNGARANYSYAYTQWDSDAIRPVHDMICTSCIQMFYNIKGAVFDLSARLKERGVKLDTSACKSFSYTFYACNSTTIPELDTRGADTVEYLCLSTPTIIEVENLILRDDGSQSFSQVFEWANNIERIKVTGVIGKNGFSTQGLTKLNRESHISIMNAISLTATITVTFSRVAVNKAFETTTGANDGSTSEEWLALVNSRPNCTISLV